MAEAKLTNKELKHIDDLVSHYRSNYHQFERIAGELTAAFTTSPSLKKLVHSLRLRIKEPDHLRDKLIRKHQKTKKDGKPFAITRDNLFRKINDLVGFRVLHLYPRETDSLNVALIQTLSEGYKLIEGPIAKCWEDDLRDYFQSIGIKTEPSERMYTSVHYVFETRSVTKFTCEVQVRTLAEELWGEVDHQLNYPHPISNVATSEQIKVLAKVTSACNRVVDSIFISVEANAAVARRKTPRKSQKAKGPKNNKR
jgi:putative GTP pyrophosphokinase